jgi:DMSO reductase anchor subunit
MHPAFSVIFFTTASGAGYGLLALLGLGTVFGWLPGDPTMVATAAISALALVTAGLLSSTFHLGHPERAWRALTQWRSSWLSREGVMALLTYVPAVVFLGTVFLADMTGPLARIAGAMSALGAVVTVFTTAMIYGSLRSIAAWHNAWVPPVYLTLAAASGMLLLTTFVVWFGSPAGAYALACAGLFVAAFSVKLAYWRHIDHDSGGTTATTAIGVDRKSRVRLTQAPHSQENYLQQEMGFKIARRHARKLRRIALAAGFVVPIVLLLTLLLDAGIATRVATIMAVVSTAVGLLIERWLFFAEAKHTVSLYYS